MWDPIEIVKSFFNRFNSLKIIKYIKKNPHMQFFFKIIVIIIITSGGLGLVTKHLGLIDIVHHHVLLIACQVRFFIIYYF
jgi:hypothetical protein